MSLQGLPPSRRQRAMAAVPWLGLVVFFAVFYVIYFSPALVQGGYLAPGDGEVYYLAFFDLPIGQIWNSSILSGYSIINDIQSQVLYPVRWLSPTFNALVISAYVVAAVSMFGLALKLTGSRIGAVMAAFIVSGSGFMVGHLGHLSIVHAAAWIPAMLWAIASLRNARSEWPVVLGAAAVALSVYGGHPQVSIIGLLLAGCYGVHEIAVATFARGPRRGLAMFLRVFALFALGLMFAAPALLPLAQSSNEGVRAGWSIADFNTFSHTLYSLRLTAFPNFYGADGRSPFGGYNGPWNLTELAIYAGLLPWLLAATALLAWRRDRSHWFWVGALVFGVLFCLGTDTTMGLLVYELPVLGKFRAQARFGIVVIIALSVLSAYGVSALLRRPVVASRRLVLIWLAVAAAAMAAVAWAALNMPLSLGGPVPSDAVASTPRLWLPLLLMAVSLLLMGLFAFKRTRVSALLCVMLVVVDLASFGWFYEWRYPSVNADQETMAPELTRTIDELARGEGRILPLDAAKMLNEPLRPNINMRHGIDSVVGYGPLLPERYAIYAGVDTTGGFAVNDPTKPIMDVLGVRWIAGRHEDGEKRFPQALGRGCGVSVAPNQVRVKIPAGLDIAALRVVSHMNCSVGIVNGRTMARLKLLDGEERRIGEALTIDAGEEIAEEAYDRADVRAAIQHRRPPVASSKPSGLWFLGELPIDADTVKTPVERIEVTVPDSGGALVTIDSVEAVERGSGRVHALAIAADETGKDVLGPKREVAGMTSFSERLRFRGMTWGVCKTAAASQEEIIAALMSGAYGGQDTPFDPFETVLLEPGQTAAPLSCRTAPKISVTKRDHGVWKLNVSGDGDLLAVVSERYDRNWIARVDGRKVPVLVADGLIMAVPVPAGEHRVELKYRPASYRIGLGLALCALLVCIALVCIRRVVSRRALAKSTPQ